MNITVENIKFINSARTSTLLHYH